MQLCTTRSRELSHERAPYVGERTSFASLRRLLPSRRNQNGPNVIDICESGTCSNEITKTLEKGVTIVSRQKRAGIELARSGAMQGIWRHQSAGGILRSINPVTIPGNGPNARRSIKGHRKSEQELGIATTTTCSAMTDANCRLSS